MNSAVQRVLDDYHARLERETLLMRTMSMDEIEAHKDEMLISIGPDSAQFFSSLIKAQRGQIIVELGASYGYSTIWFAEAARATGGRVISYELDPSKVEYIRSRLEQSGLSEFVEFRVGDAVELLSHFEFTADFILIDLWKDLYIPCFDLLLPRLARSGFIAADNMLQPPAYRRAAESYRQHVKDSGRLDSVLLPLGSGIELSRLR